MDARVEDPAHVQTVQLGDVSIRRVRHGEVVQIGIVRVVGATVDVLLKRVEQNIGALTFKAEYSLARLAPAARFEREEVRIKAVPTERAQRPRQRRLVFPIQDDVVH